MKKTTSENKLIGWDALRNELAIWKDEILTSNAKLHKKLDIWMAEVAQDVRTHADFYDKQKTP